MYNLRTGTVRLGNVPLVRLPFPIIVPEIRTGLKRHHASHKTEIMNLFFNIRYTSFKVISNALLQPFFPILKSRVFVKSTQGLYRILFYYIIKFKGYAITRVWIRKRGTVPYQVHTEELTCEINSRVTWTRCCFWNNLRSDALTSQMSEWEK